MNALCSIWLFSDPWDLDHPKGVAFIARLHFKSPENTKTLPQQKVSLGHDPKVVLNTVGCAVRACRHVLEDPYTGYQGVRIYANFSTWEGNNPLPPVPAGG